MAVSPRLVVADPEGKILDHPYLGTGRALGARRGPGAPRGPPAHARGHQAVHHARKPARWPGIRDSGTSARCRACRSAGDASPATPWRHFFHPDTPARCCPAAAYPTPQPPLPLWSYTAVGWDGEAFVAAAIRTDPMDHSAAQHYDDRELLPRMKARLKGHGDNPILTQLARCATEYHCLAAKNLFLGRWEAPLPVANSCNSACVGCLSWQPSTACASSHDRIRYAPTADHVVEVALPFLTAVPEAIVSFGQGCEGEPLLLADVIAEAAPPHPRRPPTAGRSTATPTAASRRRVEQIAARRPGQHPRSA